MAEPDKRTIPIICGPTGSGKTAVAIELSRHFPIEIVSADSRQIVKHLDIGTAKPTPEEQKAVKFHLIDIIEPGERYSAYRFIDDADRAVDSILSADRIPVVVGGTGLYLRALTDGVVEIENDDNSIRERLEKQMEDVGPDAMYENLKKLDPTEAARIHPHNKVRVIRALEICHLAGKPKSEITANGDYRKSRHSFVYFCLTPPREDLYRKIEERVDQMIEAGLVAEVQALIEEGRGEGVKKANVIGYNEIINYVDGNLSLDTAVDTMKLNSRRYAKRQLTWFRRQIEAGYYESRKRILDDIKAHCSLWPE